MKKVASLLMAAALVLSLGGAALAAADVNTETPGAGTAAAPGTTTPGTPAPDTIIIPETAAPGASGRAVTGISPMTVELVDDNKVDIKKGEMFLVESKKVLLPEMRLEPGNEFEFDIYYASEDMTAYDISKELISIEADETVDPPIEASPAKAVPLTKADIGTAKLRVRPSKGSGAISSTDLKTRGIGDSAAHYVVIETKDTYSTKQVDVEYSISITGTPANSDLIENKVLFVVGHGEMTEDDVDQYESGDEVDISNDYPIISKKLLERLAKNFDYKAVTFIAEDDSWEYTGRISGMSDTNFYYTQDIIPSIANKFDQDFEFLIFPAGVTFPTNGEMRIDVSNVSDDWSRIYTYLYRNGTLTPINTTYDGSSDQIIFRTNYLGAFVMTDVEITDVEILTPVPGEEGEITEEPVEPIEPELPYNPNTGIPAGLDLAVTLGAISLLTAGTSIIRKNKKK